MRGKNVARIAGWVLVGVAVAVAIGFVLGIVVMALWNWLMPVLFGLPEITYWQAVGIFVLAHLLLGRGFHHEYHREKKDRKSSMRERIHGKLGDEEAAGAEG